MFASYLVTGAVTTIENRFDDLIKRRSLELANNQGSDDARKGVELLKTYRSWAHVIKQKFCEFTGIPENKFYEWLQQKLQPGFSPNNAQYLSHRFVKKFYGKELQDGDFVPLNREYLGVMHRVSRLKVKNNIARARARQELEAAMKNVTRAVDRCLINEESSPDWLNKTVIENTDIPGPALLQYMLDYNLFDNNPRAIRLAQQAMTVRQIHMGICQMIKEKELAAELNFTPDTSLLAQTAFRGTRERAELGKQNQADAWTNEFMHTPLKKQHPTGNEENNNDVDYSAAVASIAGLPENAQQIIDSFRGNRPKKPFARAALGDDTEGNPVEWNGTIGMLACWLAVDGKVVPAETRFGQLHTNRGEEIGNDRLNEYFTWGKERLIQLCNLLEIAPENFNEELRKKLQPGIPRELGIIKSQEFAPTVLVPGYKKDQVEVAENEFIPLSPFYLMTMKLLKNPPLAQKVIRDWIGNYQKRVEQVIQKSNPEN